MQIVNRRNAVLGWLVWNAGKRAARKKARAVAADAPRPRGKASAALAAAVAAFFGVLALWRRRGSHD